MTELLSKEKEFLKLNEQLNRMATNSMEHQHETTSTKSSCGGNTKTDSRFLTYQKTKGQSTLLKKRGAGDGLSDVVDIFNTMATKKEQRVNTMTSNKATGGETHRSARHKYEEPTSTNNSAVYNTSQGQSSISTTLPQYRSKQSRIAEPNRSQTHSRISTSRAAPSNTSTFTVKYRNPKFVESPSLEVLLKNESSSMRCEKVSTLNASLSSMGNDDAVSSGRRSESSSFNVVSKKNISADGLIKFLKSKITILEEDHDRISLEMTQQKDLLDKALEQSKLAEQQRDQALSKNNSLTEQLSKLEIQLEDANRRLKERNMEHTSQQKELETVKRDVKILTQNNNNLEKRLYRANEELENARNALTAIKNGEREHKETARLEGESKDKQIKSLKKQRADLMNAYKKQLFLIDNLKRQNVCMEQSKMIAFGEKEFSKVLEWNMKS